VFSVSDELREYADARARMVSRPPAGRDGRDGTGRDRDGEGLGRSRVGGGGGE